MSTAIISKYQGFRAQISAFFTTMTCDSEIEAGGIFQLDFSVGLADHKMVVYIWFSRLGLGILLEWEL